MGLASANAAPTGGKVVVEALKAAGVTSVYVVPGGQTLAILDAGYDDPDIEFVAMRHEMAATHAADAHYRVTGRPGVCLVTTGPGLTHGASAVGGALRDRNGLVILSCNNRREYLYEEDAQAADHLAILRTLTKWSAQTTDARALTRTLRTAFSMAANGPAGPVHVDLPRDILEDPVPADTPMPVPGRGRYAAPPVVPSVDQLAGAANLLGGALRPVLWVGNGVARAEASADVIELAERLQAPMITTFSGIGAVPSSHPLVFGPRTRHGSRLTRSVLEQADVVLAIGMRLSSSSTHRWGASLPLLIHSDIDGAALGRHYLPDVALPGDAKLVASGLVSLLSELDVTGERKGWLDALAKERRDWQAELEAVPEENDQGRIHPIALIRQVADAAPPDAIFSVDAGNPGIWSHLLPVDRPLSYMKPVNFGQMGFALPAAIGAKRACPDRPVIALIGDGSLGMTVAELETAARERLAITIVVLNDCAYNNIRQEQLAMTGGPRYVGVDFTDVDFAKVAEGFGAWGRTARGVEQTRALLREALAQSDRPALVDVKLDGAPSVWAQPF